MLTSTHDILEYPVSILISLSSVSVIRANVYIMRYLLYRLTHFERHLVLVPLKIFRFNLFHEDVFRLDISTAEAANMTPKNNSTKDDKLK